MVFSFAVTGSEQVFIVQKADARAKEPKAAFRAKLLLGFQVPEQLKSENLRLFTISSVLILS